MSMRMRHAYDGNRIKIIWRGPMSTEQKPRLCSRCGHPVVLAYRVYKRELTRTGDLHVVKGQYEVAHVQDGQPVFDICPYPTLLQQLEERVKREQAAAESRLMASGIEMNDAAKKRRTVHWEETVKARDGTEFLRVRCGARGNLYTTLDSEAVTCSNCKPKPGTVAFVQQQGPTNQASTMNQSTSNKIEGKPTMSTTAETIKAKIAASKAKKQEGAAANLVQKDEGGAPLPKATVSKKAVQTAKAPAAPKMLNACGCGCNQPCASRFIPGHDAKLHSWIKKVGDGRMKLDDLPAQVRSGMYGKVKQTVVKSKNEKGEVVETLQGVAPSVQEAAYLETLKGLGGPA